MPTVTKDVLIEHFDDWVSDPRLKLSELNDHSLAGPPPQVVPAMGALIAGPTPFLIGAIGLVVLTRSDLGFEVGNFAPLEQSTRGDEKLGPSARKPAGGSLQRICLRLIAAEEGCLHARVTKFTVEPDRIDDANEYYRTTVLARARELDGFQGGVALVDRDGGSIFSFTLWENEEAMRSSEEAGNRLRAQAASDLQFPTPVVER